MKISEAADLLKLAALYDNRKPSELAPRAWQASIKDNVTFEDAQQIVIEHYATTRDWIMPADINARSETIRAKRIEEAVRTGDPVHPPESIDPDDPKAEAEWKRRYWRAIGDGYPAQAADHEACVAMGITRPALDPAPRPVEKLIDQASKTTRLPRRDDSTRTKRAESKEAT